MGAEKAGGCEDSADADMMIKSFGPAILAIDMSRVK